MLKELDDYDWQEAFGYAGEQGCQGYAEPQPIVNFEGETHGFSRKDVKTIIALDEGENDGPCWMGVFELKDGRFAYLEAGCDYTGWDCQAGGSSWVAGTKEDIIRFGCTDEARRRLNLS